MQKDDDARLSMTREDFTNELRGLLARLWDESGRMDSLPDLGVDDNLFDAGVVDSLTMMEVVAHVERIAQAPIDLQSLDPSALFTLNGLYEFATGS